MELLDIDLPLEKVYERKYEDELSKGTPSVNTSFDYALSLVKTKDTKCLHIAKRLFTKMFQEHPDNGTKRECLYFLAIVHYKLCDYEQSLQCCNNLLRVEPKNQQYLKLKEEIDRRSNRDGLIGGLAIGGAVAAAATILGVAIGLARRK